MKKIILFLLVSINSFAGVKLAVNSTTLTTSQSTTQTVNTCVQYEAVYVNASGTEIHPSTDKVISFTGLASGNLIYQTSACTNTISSVTVYGTTGGYPNSYQTRKYFYLKPTALQSTPISLRVTNDNVSPSITSTLSVSVTGIVTVPNAPINLAAISTSTSQINLSWTDSSTNESGFIVERSTDGVSFSQIISLSANVTSYSNTGLNASTKYYYRIKSYNSAGNSTYSLTANATTLTPAPTYCTNANLDTKWVPRDVWVWDESVATNSSKTNTFLSWAEAHNVVTVYVAGYNTFKGYASGTRSSNLTNYKNFISTAKSKCMNVEILFGDPVWIDQAGFTTPINLLKDMYAFVSDSTVTSSQKPVGVHWDVEPHLSANWSTDPLGTLSKFASLVQNLMNTTHTGLYLNFDTTNWLDSTSYASVNCNGVTKPAYKCVIDQVDRVTLMDYQDQASQINARAATEVSYVTGLNNGKKIIVGIESGDLGTVASNQVLTFYEELRGLAQNGSTSTYNGINGTKYLEGELFAVQSYFNSSIGFAGYLINGSSAVGVPYKTPADQPRKAGIAVHHYDALNMQGSYSTKPAIIQNY